MASSQGLVKLLSIDGGGVRGLAALVILEQVMYVANDERQKLGLPRQEPWQMFDIIGGTSTGGLIAIMLGRLRMPLDKCKEAYMNLSQRAFTPKNIVSKTIGGPFVGPKFKVEPLEQAIREILEAAGPILNVDPDEALLYEENGPCKVFVVSHLQNMLGNATIFRSYRNGGRPIEKLETLKIWQACRGTSAATTFFEPLTIGEDVYSDGGLVYNNPVHLVHIEGTEMFPGQETLLLSLGTGIPSDKIFDPNFANIGRQLADLATQTEREADTFFRKDGAQAARSQRYFRFNIPNIGDIALDEAKQLNTIKNAAEKFLNIGEVGLKIQSCAEQLAEGEPRLPETPGSGLSRATDVAPLIGSSLQARFQSLRPQ
ncbi:FabD/lysophospholipase-like protein [Hyaloscypha variabilis F]|uniref:FabD/lysophospholipase-like protein n=1 Tax=Hyaloscypha variabilis (strain UAMH 11265 / GT02V1 / F) TaxID=1149755 RepID=A0A2J6RYX3_HYAVF|nr:FabD/lysophospholipase-like protein [Hyaloscypha variabilis F]